MAASPQERAKVEGNRFLAVYQPALDESLEAINEVQKIRAWGVADIGNCESYYLITTAGVHYCEKEKAGAFKKRYAPRFVSLDPVEQLDIESRGSNTYLRFVGGGKTHLTMWFKDEISQAVHRCSAEDEAMDFARQYGAN